MEEFKTSHKELGTDEQISQTKSHENYECKFGQFDFSCGFKSLGSGETIKISEEAAKKVKIMFQEFDISQKKPTK